MLCKDQYFHNPHFRRVRQGMKQYGKAMIRNDLPSDNRSTRSLYRISKKIGIMWRGRS